MRMAMLVILLGFPLLELAVLVRLGESHGWLVFAWVTFAAAAGVALIKEARFALLAQLALGFAQGRYSIAALVDSARTVLAGLLLIFPGVVSDLLAVTLLLLPLRRAMVESVPARAVPGAVIDGQFRRSR